MRIISYKCNRCGKSIDPEFVHTLDVKYLIGSDMATKQLYDFCPFCFPTVKGAFLSVMKMVSSSNTELPEESVRSSLMPLTTDEPTFIEQNNIKPEKSADRLKLRLGTITPDEKKEILRLSKEEHMTPEQIAAKLNRLPRGIKRTLNAANNGREIPVTSSNKTDEPKKMISSKKPTNTPKGRPATYNVPQEEVIDGKTYDVGGIMALVNAKWSIPDIAEDKNYDEAIVQAIVEKYK